LSKYHNQKTEVDVALSSCGCIHCHAITQCWCDCGIELEVEIKAVSTNAAYRKRGYGKGMYMTKEGKTYKEAIGWAAAALQQEMYTTPVSLWLEFHYADKRKRDVDGAIKLTMDSLQNILIENDYQVQELRVRKFHDGQDLVKIKILPFFFI